MSDENELITIVIEHMSLFSIYVFSFSLLRDCFVRFYFAVKLGRRLIFKASAVANWKKNKWPFIVEL